MHVDELSLIQCSHEAGRAVRFGKAEKKKETDNKTAPIAFCKISGALPVGSGKFLEYIYDKVVSRHKAEVSESCGRITEGH